MATTKVLLNHPSTLFTPDNNSRITPSPSYQTTSHSSIPSFSLPNNNQLTTNLVSDHNNPNVSTSHPSHRNTSSKLPTMKKCNNFAIQWNTRGLISRLPNIQLILKDYSPSVLAVQDILSNTPFPPDFIKGYTLHTVSDSTSNSRQGAGLAIKNGIPYDLININSTLNVIVARIHSPIKITVVSLYIPPQISDHDFFEKLDDLLPQIPTPFIIMSDPNAHSTSWGSTHTTNKGSYLDDIATLKNLSILNNGQPTRIDPGTGNTSALDITLVSWELGPRFGWNVLPDTFGSDHFPILIKLEHPTPKAATRPRWKYSEADWVGFQNDVEYNLSLNNPSISSFTEILYNAGSKFIPRTSGVPGKTAVPWWGPEVRDAIKLRRKKLRSLKRIPNDHPEKQEALNSFRIANCAARSAVRSAKRNCWEEFTKEIHPNTPSKVLWSKIKILNGEPRKNEYHLLLNNQYTNDPLLLADAFCEQYSSISSVPNTSPSPPPTTFVPTSSASDLDYNSDFNLEELDFALHKAKGLSAGPDDIGYPFLKNLSVSAKLQFLQIINSIWNEGTIPDTWKLGLVIPIPKPKQNPHLLDSYRPITLLDCSGKIMERMVNRRLHAILDRDKRLDDRQFAFRPGKSTDDYFGLLESILDESLDQHQHIEVLSLDLSKAFDRVDRSIIINTLCEWGIEGRMIQYIRSFLSDRSIQVLINGVRSFKKSVHAGVPQGSVIAPTLFLIAINTLFQIIPENIQIIIYADDILLISTSVFARLARKRLQLALDKVAEWAPTVGFRFSPTKSSLLHLGPNRKKLSKLPSLTMLDQNIPLSHNTKILGVWLDDHLNFGCHLNQVRKNATNKINLLCILSKSTSSAHRDSLFRFLRGWLLPSVLH